VSDIPKGLPKGDPTEEASEVPIHKSAKARTCKVCGRTDARITSNSSGMGAYCACGNSWPLAAKSMSSTLPVTPSRGLSKQTRVEPDWDRAFDDLEGDAYEQVGPKRKR
jgi:hypothetical protein